MKYEDVLLHPYYEQIKNKCFADEAGTQISNWVKNTVDTDDSIPDDKKPEYYLSDRKINAYKDLLQQQTKEMTMQMLVPNPMPVVATNPPPASDTKKEMNVAYVFKPILVKDAEQRAVDFIETFFNLFIMNQERMRDLLEKTAQFGVIDPAVDRSIKGYLGEMRQLLELFVRATGREEFAKTLGKAAGEHVARNVLPESVKTKLKMFVRDLLADTDPGQIPDKLAKLEEILNAAE